MAAFDSERFATAAETMAQATQSLADSARLAAATQRVALRLQTCALVLVGLALLSTGVLVWQGVRLTQDHGATLQTLAVQTQALRDLLRQRQP